MKILISTKKSTVKGIIITTGYKYLPEVLNYIDCTSNKVYVTKHSENKNKPTHIVKRGIINRYGWFITKDEIDFSEVKDIDIEKGWFILREISSIEDIEKYL